MFCQDYGPGGGGHEPDFWPFEPQIVISVEGMLDHQRALYTVLAFLNGCTPAQVVRDMIEEVLG